MTPDLDTVALEMLADLADQTADECHTACQSLQVLAERLLSNIENIGGDREYNYGLYADLSHAATLLGSTMFKAQAVARHTRAER